MYENSGDAKNFDDASIDDSGNWTAADSSAVHNGIVDPPEDSTYTISATAANGTATRQASVISGRYYRIKASMVRSAAVDVEIKLIFDQSVSTSSYTKDVLGGEIIYDQVFLANATTTVEYGIEIEVDTEAVILDEISLYEVEVIGEIKTDSLLAGDANIIITDSVEEFTDDGLGVLTGDKGGSGTITYATGQYSLTFNTAPLDGADITANYRFNAPDRPVMGLPNYLSGNDPSLMRFDTEKAFLLDENDLIFKEIPFKLGNAIGAFTGDDSDFFWAQNWADTIYITNNADQIQKYQGTEIEDFDIDLSGGDENDIDTCLMIFIYKSRIMMLRTTESGTIYPQRARWSEVSAGGIVIWEDNFVDAPTHEFIVSASFLGEDLIVFFESSVWRLVYTGNSILPFRWERISEFQGSPSTFGTITFPDKLTAVGNTNLIGANSTSIFDIDQRIPQEMLKFQQDRIDYSYAIRIDETNESMVTFVSSDATDDLPNKQLVINFDNNSWSMYDLPVHSFGQTTVQSDLILDNIEEVLDTIEISFDDESLQAGFPVTVFGDKNGVVYRYNVTTADDGSAIDFVSKTIQLNPATAHGVSVRLGYVDFLLSSDPDNTIEVSLYLNQETSPYLTETVDAIGDGDKVWKRVYTGATSNFHQIEIVNNTSTDDIEIHAIVPYFDIGGRQI